MGNRGTSEADVKTAQEERDAARSQALGFQKERDDARRVASDAETRVRTLLEQHSQAQSELTSCQARQSQAQNDLMSCQAQQSQAQNELKSCLVTSQNNANQLQSCSVSATQYMQQLQDCTVSLKKRAGDLTMCQELLLTASDTPALPLSGPPPTESSDNIVAMLIEGGKFFLSAFANRAPVVVSYLTSSPLDTLQMSLQDIQTPHLMPIWQLMSSTDWSLRASAPMRFNNPDGTFRYDPSADNPLLITHLRFEFLPSGDPVATTPPTSEGVRVRLWGKAPAMPAEGMLVVSSEDGMRLSLTTTPETAAPRSGDWILGVNLMQIKTYPEDVNERGYVPLVLWPVADPSRHIMTFMSSPMAESYGSMPTSEATRLVLGAATNPFFWYMFV